MWGGGGEGPGRWAREMFSAVIICIRDFFSLTQFIIINLNVFDIALMFFFTIFVLN